MPLRTRIASVFRLHRLVGVWRGLGRGCVRDRGRTRVRVRTRTRVRTRVRTRGRTRGRTRVREPERSLRGQAARSEAIRSPPRDDGGDRTPNGLPPYEHGAMEESLPVKTIGDGPAHESKALARDGGPGGLISILKGLEIDWLSTCAGGGWISSTRTSGRLRPWLKLGRVRGDDAHGLGEDALLARRAA